MHSHRRATAADILGSGATVRLPTATPPSEGADFAASPVKYPNSGQLGVVPSLAEAEATLTAPGPVRKQPGKLTLDARGVLEASPAPAAYQVSVMRWLANPEREELNARMQHLIDQGKAHLVEVSAASLRSMADDGRILFRERLLDRSALDKIKLPLDPRYLERPEKEGLVVDGPITLVRVGVDIAVPNGNHRAFKVAHQDGTAHPLLGVFFDSPGSYAYYLGTDSADLVRRSCRFPEVGNSARKHNA